LRCSRCVRRMTYNNARRAEAGVSARAVRLARGGAAGAPRRVRGYRLRGAS
jgi:hypothetical protein